MKTETPGHAIGTVVRALGNLLHVRFEGDVRQGEIAYVQVGEESLLSEVIEVASREVKLQVFEDTRGVERNTPVRFTGHLLEAQLGPGLLSSIFDGLQNPLEKIADKSGVYLKRGIYLPPLDMEKQWEFTPVAEEGVWLHRGDLLGTVPEGRFSHKVMVPFSISGKMKLLSIAKKGLYRLEEVIATGEDEEGRPISCSLLQKWPVKMPLIEGKRVRPTRRLETGLRILDTQFPVLKGGTFCSPGPFGAGKTVLQHHLSKYAAVDIVVVVACGERAGEVVEMLQTFPQLSDPHTGEALMKRTIMVCNTSSMPVAAREASVYMGATLAEYYRQMGLDVLLLVDSTSRWAQGMREMSGRLEEIPGDEAFPAYLPSRISAFYERAGEIQMGDKTGSLTIAGSVSPAGGNFEEPVTQASLSIVGAFHGLSRARSEARRFPAIDPLISWTKYLQEAGKELDTQLFGWANKVKRTALLLQRGDEIGKRMEVVGEEGVSMEDMVVYLQSELYDFCYLQQNAFDREDTYCPMERQVELFGLVQSIFERSFDFDSHDAARAFFLGLQNEIKNMNFTPFRSQSYRDLWSRIEEKIHGYSQGGRQ